MLKNCRRMLYKKFGDHSSIISVAEAVIVFSFTVEASKINLITDYLRMLQTKFGDHPAFSSVQKKVIRFFYF
jgi:hypothetical protein